jgi:hypothetical protein
MAGRVCGAAHPVCVARSGAGEGIIDLLSPVVE